MQPVRSAVSIVSYVMGAPESRVNMMARALIDAGILPKSSGRNIKKIDGEGLAALVAAVALADRGEDAPDVARAVTALMLEGKITDARFGWFFGTFMRPDAENFPSVELGKTEAGYTASFINEVNSERHVVAFWEADTWGGWVKRTVLIDKSGIEIMRNLFIREDADGMVFKRG